VWVARSLGMHSKPVVALDVDGLYAPLRAQVDLMVERGFVRPPAVQALQWAGSVEEALDLVEAGLDAPRQFTPLAEEVLEAEP
jgi:predicted Rossmann-fold nucleotide-binding protein